MFLYHGTSAAAVPSILKHGLQPRQISGVEPTSQIFEFQGDPECVNLANAYASFFAAEAISFEDGFTGEAAILEIDTNLLDQELFLHDDFVQAQKMRDYPWLEFEPFEELVAQARELNHNHNWGNSLELMGTCSYCDTVPPAAIKRACYIDFSKMNPSMFFDITEITLSVEAFRVYANKYRMLDAWFWGGEVKFGFGLLSEQQFNLRTRARARKEFRELWSDRSMVRIEECG